MFDDIARSVVLALTAERDNLPVNIGTGVDTSIATLAEILLRRWHRRRSLSTTLARSSRVVGPRT